MTEDQAKTGIFHCKICGKALEVRKRYGDSYWAVSFYECPDKCALAAGDEVSYAND